MHEFQIPPWHEIDSVILDMDGTLLDLYFDTQVWNELLPERFARKLNADLASAKETVAERLEDARGTLLWYCLDHWYDCLGIDIGALEVELSNLVKPREYAIEFLRRLRAMNKRLMLATNAHPSGMARKFALTGLDEHFDSVTSSHEYGHCKENAAFWHAYQLEYQFVPSRTLFIDDNFAVLDAARDFGLRYVYGVKYPDSRGSAKESKQYFCLQNLTEILPVPAH